MSIFHPAIALISSTFLLMTVHASAMDALVVLKPSSTSIGEIRKRQEATLIPIQISGIIEIAHDGGGGKFVLVSKNERYQIAYFGSPDEPERDNALFALADRRQLVTIAGTLIKFKEGSIRPISNDLLFDTESIIAIFDSKDFEREVAEARPEKRNTRRECSGVIQYGSLDSEVGNCTFLTGSSEGSKILRICTAGRKCTVDALVEEPDLIIKVYSVKKN